MTNREVTKMHVLVYVIAYLYSLKWFGICTEVSYQNSSDEDLIKFVTSERFDKEEQIYLETTEIPVDESFNHNSSISYKKYFLKPEPLISEPLIEDMIVNTSSLKGQNRKRDIPEHGLSHEEKMQLLQLHNLYRGNVTPSAGNMAYMEWDEELATLAQIWADGCGFDHGMPDNDYPDTIGQNLYMGADPTGYKGLQMWFEEAADYDLRSEKCTGEMCGHYVQMAWSASDKLGCGRTKCKFRYYLVCHYRHQALRGYQVYRVANPCSQCPPKNLCLNNLCMTLKQCKNNPFDCKFAECNLQCQNCGRLDKEKCLCECADGWDSPDCSHLCEDENVRCGKNPGWPTKTSCSFNRQPVAERFCRKMCEMCKPVNISASNNTCCDGKLCDTGYVLDLHENSCKCTQLCPGPLCDNNPGKFQALLENSANYLSKISSLAQWIIVFTLYFRLRILWKYF